MKKITDYKRMNPKACPPLPFIEKDEVFYSKKDNSFIVWDGKKFIKYIKELSKRE